MVIHGPESICSGYCWNTPKKKSRLALAGGNEQSIVAEHTLVCKECRCGMTGVEVWHDRSGGVA